MTASKRFKKVREYLGLTQQELADKLGFKQYKIKDIETEKQKVSSEIAENIENFFSISGWWLLTGKGDMLLKDEKSLPAIPNKALSTDVVSVNFYPDIYAAAGYGAINEYGLQPEVMTFDRKFLQELLNVRNVSNLDIIRVAGDSMEPFIHNGEYVLLERSHQASNGETVIANIQGQVYIKRFHTDPFKTWIKLVSDNEQYGDINLDTPEHLEALSIIGIVRAKIKPF